MFKKWLFWWKIMKNHHILKHLKGYNRSNTSIFQSKGHLKYFLPKNHQITFWILEKLLFWQFETDFLKFVSFTSNAYYINLEFLSYISTNIAKIKMRYTNLQLFYVFSLYFHNITYVYEMHYWEQSKKFENSFAAPGIFCCWFSAGLWPNIVVYLFNFPSVVWEWDSLSLNQMKIYKINLQLVYFTN